MDLGAGGLGRGGGLGLSTEHASEACHEGAHVVEFCEGSVRGRSGREEWGKMGS